MKGRKEQNNNNIPTIKRQSQIQSKNNKQKKFYLNREVKEKRKTKNDKKKLVG